MIYQMALAAADDTSAAEEVAEVTQDTVEEVSRMTQLIQDNIPQIIGFALQVVLALVFFFIGRALIKWVRKIVRKSFERSKADAGVATFVDSLLKYGLYFLLIWGATSLSVGAGDYLNVFNALTQMPRGARTYLYQFNSWWYLPQ